MMYTTVFGQTIKEGDWVGWGGREYNSSKRQVGVVEKFKSVVHERYDWQERKMVPLPPVHKVYVSWYASTGLLTRDKSHKSWVQVNDLFLLDPETLKHEILERYVPF